MDSDAQRSLHDDPGALQTMLLLLRRADLHRVRSINSGWRDGVKAVLLSEEWQRSFADLVTVRSPTQELALRLGLPRDAARELARERRSHTGERPHEISHAQSAVASRARPGDSPRCSPASDC